MEKTNKKDAVADRKMPSHIAIVMDGNGRWAKKRFLPRAAGHKAGYKQARALVKHAGEIGVEAVTLYTFSTENWRRPESEVNFLMDMYAKCLVKEAPDLNQNNVCVNVIGSREGLPADLIKAIDLVQSLTENNDGLKLNLAINYGSRWEIMDAAKQFAKDVASGKVDADSLTESLFDQYLTTNHCPDVDLFIRTSGAIRISNYLLWQSAYAELYFTDVHFPDFTPARLDKAIEWFGTKERRFGKISEQLKEGASC